jgi:hypothetical protein
MVRFDRENLLLKSLITWQEALGIDGLEAGSVRTCLP